jgi:hypothetical protein
MSETYVQIRNNEVINLLVADDKYIKKQPRPDEFVLADDITGSKVVGSRLHDDGVFYYPQPHPQWITDGVGGWRPPLEKPNPWQNLTISGHFGNTAEQIHELPGVVPATVADEVVAFADSIPEDEWSTESTSSTRVLFPDDLKDRSPHIYDLISSIALGVAEQINTTFNVRVGTPRIAITRMGEGAFQIPHPDKRIDVWVYMDEYPPDNDLTAVIYYNDDFTGGELFFPQHDVEIAPSKGMVVMYPGDNEHLHGVQEITSGVRYTTPLFFPIVELL